MEFFPDGHHVRLRSRVHGTYLHADDDGVGVSLRPRRAARATMNAAWRVQRLVRDGTTYVLLQGAAYGRYLGASFAPAPPGHRGQRVHQRDYDEPEVDAIMWKGVRAEDGDADDVVVRHVTNRLLRANGRYRPWYTDVSVEDYDNLSTMMHWVVEGIPPRPGPPVLPGPTPFLGALPGSSSSRFLTFFSSAFGSLYCFGEQFGIIKNNPGGGFGGLFRRHAQPVVEPWRTIRYVRADDFGNFNQLGWATFQFHGRSVFNLRTEVAHHVGNAIFFFGITVCVRPGVYGRLTPLVIDLHRSEETMDIIVLTTGSPAAEELRYPNVDAP
ncbi:uncharacterized protein LOC133930260 [Phragmites australis]|uniref:uncharacterized protein LOC133930260 n=1 Tax=Phragmites australis TaxID=29695 RepID=UPI002D7652BB|nr:uncharacterized protein LOC133930260 [Phragmites australis]